MKEHHITKFDHNGIHLELSPTAFIDAIEASTVKEEESEIIRMPTDEELLFMSTPFSGGYIPTALDTLPQPTNDAAKLDALAQMQNEE